MDAGTKAINYTSIAIGGILGASVGWIIYQRTMARARELEIEELEAGNVDPVPSRNGAGYNDIEGDSDAAALMDPDDISLVSNFFEPFTLYFRSKRSFANMLKSCGALFSSLLKTRNSKDTYKKPRLQIYLTDQYANIFKWDNEDREPNYRDDFTDDDELDVFASGDRDARGLPKGQGRG